MRFIVSAPSRIMLCPTATEPVKEILATSDGVQVRLRRHHRGRSPHCKRLSESCLLQTLQKYLCLQGTQLARFDDNRTTGGHRRGELSPMEQGVCIPRRNETRHADRLEGPRSFCPNSE